MTTVFFLRHATTAPHLGRDENRVLSAYGREEAKGVGRYLAALGKQGVAPQTVLASPAKRVQQTIAGLKDGGFHTGLTLDDALYNCSVETLKTAPQDFLMVRDDVQRLLVVAHNPALLWLASDLSKGQVRDYAPATLMKTVLKENGTYEFQECINAN